VTPRVSILLPAYDAAPTLPTCLRSIERQSETRFECVVVDDGSRDGTAEVVRTVARRDPRFELVSAPHRGLVEALKLGLAHCRAPVVARMDADDWMHRDRLAAQLAALAAQPELAAVGCHVRIFPRTREAGGRRAYEAWLAELTTARDVRRDAFVECGVAHPTWMIRREVLTRFGYRDLGWPEDYDLLLRLLASGHEVGVVPRRLLGWRDHPGRLSRVHPAYELERFTACKAAHLADGLLAGGPEYILWGYGDTGRLLSRALRAHGKQPVRIVELHPGRIGQRIHGAAVIAPEALAEAPRRPIVASVSGPEARRKIRAFLRSIGRRDGIDFVCAA
jgi:glycosyltransferase involved in cell wall biosynthesis